ncbi:hypothetical protein NYZ99_15075 [Maribacter litopenaei]|uniref:DUF2231 domain-containing protein n=1 Tax=Maribacter litopenaei TaxID=2976127 RepID=A0ABY5Y5I2_9FLAO|nr:hypothetical protein [Maribacter litopenaei]UWX54263.1 hypothetical protein NYZ99_15075 [Maribacter litopenaei]
MTLFLSSDFTYFLGRFHPVLVHLPIGFLLLAIFMEWYQRLKGRKIDPLIGYAWLLGSVGGLASIIYGWWLGETGLYLGRRFVFSSLAWSIISAIGIYWLEA